MLRAWNWLDGGKVLRAWKFAELMAKCSAHCKFLETIVLHVVRVLHVLPLSLQVAKHPTFAAGSLASREAPHLASREAPRSLPNLPTQTPKNKTVKIY